ncbi:hypothetical protein [Aldersonia kunmingensis]|uniref:hypothetical protein n=1 Tax=Aldersonia kunmingensis TaxID=408066 RepID=UPI0008310932|nr:hypothetical protein [Aldersonia kunmingensis]
MANNGPFGFDPEDFERAAREAGEGLREVFENLTSGLTQTGGGAWTSVFSDLARAGQQQRTTKPETTGDAGSGVWAIFVLDGDGIARVDQVYPTELDALRANRENTDPRRRVRFLPYGVTISILDQTEDGDSDAAAPTPEPPTTEPPAPE